MAPDPDILIDRLSYEKRAWLDVERMHDALKLTGQSSDESVAGEDVYYVRKMDWRSQEVVKHYDFLKIAQNAGFDQYGKRRSGTKPRTRKRRQGAALTSRRPPAGLPINLYDAGWYMALSKRDQRDLDAKEAIEFLTAAGDDV